MRMLLSVLALSLLANIVLPSNPVIADSKDQIRSLENRINDLERKHRSLENPSCWSQVLSNPENSSWGGFRAFCT